MIRTARPFVAAALMIVAVALFAARGLAGAGGDKAAVKTEPKKKIVLIAGGPSHGFGGHDHKAGCYLLAKRINELAGYEAVVLYRQWPQSSAFDGASAVVNYCDGGNTHMALPHAKELLELSDKGVGVGFIHYGVEPGDETKADNGRPEFLKLTGGYFETNYSVNPTWRGTFDKFPKHPVANGVQPFTTDDEWYYHMRFRENMEGVTPILTTVPPDATRRGQDNAHGGNPAVRADLGKNVAEHVMWVSENKSGSRGFGVTGAHYHRNWANDQFRKVVLNAIVWIAKGEVPANGVESKRPDIEEMLQNHDETPTDRQKEQLKQQIEQVNDLKPANAGAAPAAAR